MKPLLVSTTSVGTHLAEAGRDRLPFAGMGAKAVELSPSVKAVVDGALRISPLQAAFRAAYIRRLVVLAYHAIEDSSIFARHIEYVRRVRTPVALADVLAHLDGQRGLPPRSVLLTFDDGHPSVLHHALPVLRDHGVPGVAFVVTGVIGTTDPLWWDEVKALAAAGGSVAGSGWLSGAELVRWLKTLDDGERSEHISELRESVRAPAPQSRQLTVHELRTLDAAGIRVESHSASHRNLARCDDEVVEKEVAGSRDALQAMLGRPVEAFAYPDGSVDARAVRTMQRAGYRAAFLFDHRVNRPSRVDSFAVSRVRVNSMASMNRLAMLVSGLHPALHHARGRR